MYAAILVLAVSTNFEYDDHVFGLQNGSSGFVLTQDSGVFPDYQENYVVQNIGRSPIDAQVWYGDEVQWFGVIHGATIYPGETKEISNDRGLYYVTGLKLLNPYKTRAIVAGKGGDVYSPYVPSINFDPFRFLKTAFELCVKYIDHNPIIGIFFELVEMFWPHNNKHPDIWQEVVNEIKPLLQENELHTIEAILQGITLTYKDKISSLDREMNNTNIREHYMQIAYDFVGSDEPFHLDPSFPNSQMINFYVLPLYSNFISMKINFYLLGIRNKDKIGLTDTDIQNISEYASKTFENATKYIKSMLKEPVDHAYNIVDAQSIFNSIMTVRSHLAIHGEEYLPVWKYQLLNPFSDKKVNTSVMIYSTFFGRATPNLFAQAAPVNVPAPLCPELINGERDILTNITFYLYPNSPLVLSIAGAILNFESGYYYNLGSKTAIIKQLDLQGVVVLKLTAFGEGKIGGLTFYLSDGRNESFGTTSSQTFKDFKLSDHRIASFYLSSDSDELGGQAANIAVSYQYYNIN